MTPQQLKRNNIICLVCLVISISGRFYMTPRVALLVGKYLGNQKET